MPLELFDEEAAPPERHGGPVRLRLAVLSGVVVLVLTAAVTLVTGGLIWAPVAAVAAALLAWIVADRALRPVAVLEQRYRGLLDGDPRLRMTEPTGEDEPARLARTMNRALDRRESGADRRLEFVGDAADAVRGPLAALRADLVAARNAADPHDAGALDRAVADAELLQSITADVLLLARLRAGERPHREILPWFEVMTDVRAPVGVGFSVEGDLATLVVGARSHLAVMLRYLIDESAAHAASAVVLRIGTFDDAVVLRVDDDGPPVSAPERERALAPFADGDDSTGDGPVPGGTGLGLVIVAEIVRAHGGSIRIEDSPRGGTRLRVEFPAVAAIDHRNPGRPTRKKSRSTTELGAPGA